MRKFMLVGMLVCVMLAGCATQNGVMTLTAGTSTATISAPMPWWGEPTGYVSLDTPTTHTQAAYGVSKKGDVSLGMAAIGGGVGLASGQPELLAPVLATGGGFLGKYLDNSSTDTLNTIAAQALRARARRGLAGDGSVLPVE